MAEFQLGAVGGSLLVARRGDDVALLPETLGWWASQTGGWRRNERPPGYAWYVFDDRQMYRPGEEVKVKGWIRQVGPGPKGDVTPLPESVRELEYVARDSQGNEFAKGKGQLNAFGGFDLSLKLPATMNLGAANLQLTAVGQGHMHVFQVQEFRRPEFEVNASASEGPHLLGAHAEVTVTAVWRELQKSQNTSPPKRHA